MTREQAKELLPAFTAWAEGKIVQARRRNGKDTWDDQIAFSPTTELEWRPKPEPVARPWTAEEVPLGKEVRMKERPAMRGLIIAITGDGNVAVSWYGVIAPKELFTYWTLADGSPCGTTDPA